MAKDRTAWFTEAGWGVFCHYLASEASSTEAPKLTPEAWNRRVNNFDVDGLATQLASIGADYLLFTIGQNSGFYCAPNSTYDSIVGIEPSKCSRRDLISDLSEALAPHGIKLMTYLPSGAPSNDPVAKERLGWEDLRESEEEKRLAEFQEKWQAIIREWAERWEKKVSGWWLDGCYFPDVMYRHPEPPNFKSFAEALRAGNPERILAFNPGVRVPVTPHTEYEDYTAGELAHSLQVGYWGEDGYQSINGTIDGVQYHVTTFMGQYWGRGEPRFSDDFVSGYTKYITDQEGIISWDVPIQDDGLIREEYINKLSNLD